MAHQQYGMDYTIANQVRALIEENTDQKNQIADLTRDLRQAKSNLVYIRDKRQRLEEELARLL